MKRVKNREQNVSYYGNIGAVPEIVVKSSKNRTIKHSFFPPFPPGFGNQSPFFSSSLRLKIQIFMFLNISLRMLLFCKQGKSFKHFCSYLKFIQYWSVMMIHQAKHWSFYLNEDELKNPEIIIQRLETLAKGINNETIERR